MRSRRQREGWNQRKGGAGHRAVPQRLLCTNKCWKPRGRHECILSAFEQICFFRIFNDEGNSWSSVALERVMPLHWRYVIFFFSSCTQQMQEHKLKMSTRRDLRPITCIWQTGFIYFFLPRKPYTKCIFPWKAELKKAFVVGHYLCSISRQYLLAVRVTALAPPCFHSAPVTVHLEDTNAFCILSPHRTQNNTHANSGY